MESVNRLSTLTIPGSIISHSASGSRVLFPDNCRKMRFQSRLVHLAVREALITDCGGTGPFLEARSRPGAAGCVSLSQWALSRLREAAHLFASGRSTTHNAADVNPTCRRNAV